MYSNLNSEKGDYSILLRAQWPDTTGAETTFTLTMASCEVLTKTIPDKKYFLNSLTNFFVLPDFVETPALCPTLTYTFYEVASGTVPSWIMYDAGSGLVRISTRDENDIGSYFIRYRGEYPDTTGEEETFMVTIDKALDSTFNISDNTAP